MSDNENFDRLEKTVEKFLGLFQAMKKEKAELEIILQEKETKISDLERKIDTLTDDRTRIHGRVSTLLNSIEEWEKGQAAPIAMPGGKTKPGGTTAVQEGGLFSMND